MTENDIARLMDEYRTNVRALFDKRASDVIDNSSYRHASVLIEEMVRHAQHTFIAFAGRMNPQVWTPQVMNALADAVQRGVNVRLLVERNCEPISNGSMPHPVQERVRRISEEYLGKIGDISHCASGDSESFRIEMDRVQNSAVFAANNPEIASKVVGIFDALFEMGEPYNHAA